MTSPTWLARLRAHRVTRNAAALALVQVVNYGVALAVLFHLTRVLGVAMYGVVAFGVGITSLLSVVLDLGFGFSVTQRIAVRREDSEAVGRIAGAAFALKLMAWVIGAALLLAYALLTRKYAAYAALFMLLPVPLLGFALQPWWFFAGIERMRNVTAFTVVARLTYLASVLLFVSSPADYLWVPVADGIAQLAAAAVALRLVWTSGYRVRMPTRRDLGEELRATRGFFFSVVAQTVQSNGGVVLLGLAASPAMVATYALAEQAYRAMHAAFSPVVHALYPHMAKERNVGLLARVALVCLGVAVVGAIALHVVADPMLPRLLGEEWRAALPVLDVFLIAIVVHVVVLMAGYPLAAALGRLEVVNWSVVIGSGLYLAAALVLIKAHAVSHTAFAWLLVAGEAYMLVHCTVRLLPAARRAAAA